MKRIRPLILILGILAIGSIAILGLRIMFIYKDWIGSIAFFVCIVVIFCIHLIEQKYTAVLIAKEELEEKK